MQISRSSELKPQILEHPLWSDRETPRRQDYYGLNHKDTKFTKVIMSLNHRDHRGFMKFKTIITFASLGVLCVLAVTVHVSRFTIRAVGPHHPILCNKNTGRVAGSWSKSSWGDPAGRLKKRAIGLPLSMKALRI